MRSNLLPIVLEDLHWGDRPTVQFVDRALAELDDRPLFVLALARPEVSQMFPRLWAERGAHELRLKELSTRAIERLVRHALGEAVTPTTVERLAGLSDGNAFYLEELIRWASERHEGPLPETLVTMVQSRLGALDDESRRVLRVASVFGEVFWLGAVASSLGDSEDTVSLRARLTELADREVLIERSGSRFSGDCEYAFRHALLREGPMRCSPTRTARSVIAWPVTGWEIHGEEDPLLLAEHLEKGGEGVRAAMQYLLAAKRASAGSDTTRALECIERGLSNCLLLGTCAFVSWGRSASCTCTGSSSRSRDCLRPGLCWPRPIAGAAWTQALLLTLICAAQTGSGQDLADALDAAAGADFQPEALEAATILLGFGVAFSDHAGEVRRSAAMVSGPTLSSDPGRRRSRARLCFIT